MSERPNFAKVLAEHIARDRYDDENGAAIGTECTCGSWSGNYFADGEVGPFDAHLAAALNAEVDRWLADEGTRERVLNDVCPRASGPCSTCCETVPAALAALATPTVPTAEEGER